MPNSLLVGWETVHRLMGSLASFWERVHGLLGPPASFMPLHLVQCVAEDQRTSWWRLPRKYESLFSSHLEKLPYHQKDNPYLMKNSPPYWPDGGSSVLESE